MKKLSRTDIDHIAGNLADKLICYHGIKNAYSIAHRLKMGLKAQKADIRSKEHDRHDPQEKAQESGKK